jgi:hypothetical protein
MFGLGNQQNKRMYIRNWLFPRSFNSSLFFLDLTNGAFWPQTSATARENTSTWMAGSTLVCCSAPTVVFVSFYVISDSFWLQCNNSTRIPSRPTPRFKSDIYHTCLARGDKLQSLSMYERRLRQTVLSGVRTYNLLPQCLRRLYLLTLITLALRVLVLHMSTKMYKLSSV